MTKLEQSIAYLLSKQPSESMEILRLAKYLYLADYIFAKTFGKRKPFTGGYSRFKLGPVPLCYYNALENLKKDNLSKNGNVITLDKIPKIELKEEEVACLDKVIDDFKDKTTTQVLNVAYSTEPMGKILEAENSLNQILNFEKIDFEDTIEPHPLLQNNEKLDVSFTDTDEFKKYLENEDT